MEEWNIGEWESAVAVFGVFFFQWHQTKSLAQAWNV